MNPFNLFKLKVKSKNNDNNNNRSFNQIEIN